VIHSLLLCVLTEARTTGNGWESNTFIHRTPWTTLAHPFLAKLCEVTEAQFEASNHEPPFAIRQNDSAGPTLYYFHYELLFSWLRRLLSRPASRLHVMQNRPLG
jgi:hypothetical protein